jgi:hypothetical protein
MPWPFSFQGRAQNTVAGPWWRLPPQPSNLSNARYTAKRRFRRCERVVGTDSNTKIHIPAL